MKKSMALTVLLVLFTAKLFAQINSGKSIVSSDLNDFRLFGASASDSVIEIIPVDGQPFKKCLGVNTFGKQLKGQTGVTMVVASPVEAGDVLWVSFKARSLESRRETGESLVELRVDQLENGKYVWPPYLERGVSFGKEWTETSIPFVITKDVAPENIRLLIGFDSYPNKIEIGPVTFLNYGKSVKINDLPRTRFNYGGSEPDAEWRKEAAARIEKYRKGNLSVRVVNAEGKPVKGAEVKISMTRNAFNWGTAISSQRFMDTTADSKKYRDTLLKYFNQVVFENEMKWGMWERQNPETRGAQTRQVAKMLSEKGITSRGHVMVWPSWRHLPGSLSRLKNDTAALRKVLTDHIKEQTSLMKGCFAEWDVINEPYAHHDLMDILGKDEMVRWFKIAKEGDPQVKLFLNEYTMFHGEGADSPSEKYWQTVKFLLEKGAPIDAIGEQGHIGGTPPSIPKVMERLDYFAKLGLPVQISEFDINSNDDEFKARYMADFMTAVYSNPSTVGFVQWGFWEGMHWFPVAALWNKDWTLRSHGKVYTDLVTKTWWTNTEATTSKEGVVTMRGFCGDYEVEVKEGGKTVKERFNLDTTGKELLIQLKH